MLFVASILSLIPFLYPIQLCRKKLLKETELHNANFAVIISPSYNWTYKWYIFKFSMNFLSHSPCRISALNIMNSLQHGIQSTRIYIHIAPSTTVCAAHLTSWDDLISFIELIPLNGIIAFVLYKISTNYYYEDKKNRRQTWQRTIRRRYRKSMKQMSNKVLWLFTDTMVILLNA